MVRDTDTIEYITFTEETPSLEELDNEPVAVEIFRDLLRDQWRTSIQLPQPEIHVLNDVEYPEQGHMRSDWIIISMSSMDEQQRGYRYEFKDFEIPIQFEIHTIQSRQRLYNLMAEVRRIIYKNHIVVRPYQMVYWDSFEEDSDGMHRYWKGMCNIRATSEGVPVFKGTVAGMGSPNLPSDQR